MSTPTRNFPPTRRLILLFMIGALVALVVLPFNPLHNTLTKAGYLLAVGVAYLGLLVVFWKKISLRLLAWDRARHRHIDSLSPPGPSYRYGGAQPTLSA